MLSKSNALLVGLTLCIVSGAASYRAFAAAAQTQSFFFRVTTKNNSPEVSHTVGVVASSQSIAEDLALDYAENTWGGTGWYVAGDTSNHGQVHINGSAP